MDQQITREQTREFFMQVPAIVDYLPLTPYAFRLYAHYVRVCGDESGKCWESVRTTSKHTRMSIGMVVKAREQLTQTGLIRTHQETHQDTIHIRLRNIWTLNSLFLDEIRENSKVTIATIEAISTDGDPRVLLERISEYLNNPQAYLVKQAQKERCSCGEHPCSCGEHPCSCGEHPCSCGERGCSPHEPNKISINKIPDSQIASKKIEEKQINAAADSNPPLQENQIAREGSSRARDGEDEIWWNLPNAWVSRAAVERVCSDYMTLDDWRDRQAVIEHCDIGELLNLLLWLKYAEWNGANMVENGMRNIPGYIRGRLKERPPNYSQQDIQDLMVKISQYSDTNRIPF